MKKVMSILLVLSVLGLTACGKTEHVPPSADSLVDYNAEEVSIDLWSFPIGNWSDRNIASSVITEFNEVHPNINVNLKFLDYTTGDQQIADAIAEGNGPDIIFEGPERLIVDYAANNRLAPMDDLWSEYYASTIATNIADACKYDDTYYMMPLCASAHCMVINKEMFNASGALQLIDKDKRTWSADDFFTALDLLSDWGVKYPCIIYCKDQSGDQGTRALINNLSGGSFTNREHTAYSVNSQEYASILTQLQENDNVHFMPEMGASDAINAFCDEEAAMLFCWNISLSTTNEIASQNITFETMPVNFPTADTGVLPRLDHGFWGFCVFDNGDEGKIEASKTLVRELTSDTIVHEKAVIATNCWPVISCKDIYVNDARMEEYSMFLNNIGDFYQVTDNWSAARSAWWQVLQEIGAGTEVTTALQHFDGLLLKE